MLATHSIGVNKLVTGNTMGFIYKITNTRNGKVYIGQTINKPEKRITEHLNGHGQCPALSNAIKGHGKKAFVFEILHEVFDFMLNDLEIQEIKNHNSLVPNGYNLTFGGEGGSPSLETRKKMSQSRIGNTNKTGKKESPETREKKRQMRLGKKHSPETIEKIRESNKGLKRKPETRKKASKARTHPEKHLVRPHFFAIPTETSTRSKHKTLYNQFPHIPRRNIRRWVKEWSTHHPNDKML